MSTIGFSKSNLYGLTERQIIECIAQRCITTVRPELQKRYEGPSSRAMLGAVHDIVMMVLTEKDLSKEELTEILEFYNDEKVDARAKELVRYVMENVK